MTQMSSNYRELLNLVELLEEAMASGALEGAEVFLFPDNTTAEYVFLKETHHQKHCSIWY